MPSRAVGLPLLFCFLWAAPAFAQSGLTLFTDCDNCDRNYLIQNLPFLEHVSVRTGADVRLLVTDGGTGGGGRRYELTFTGLEDLSGITNEYVFELPPNSTDDLVRQRLLGSIKRGILPYLIASGYADRIDYTITDVVIDSTDTATDASVPWDRWVFELYAEGGMESESAQKAAEIEGGFEANRTTEALRIRSEGEWSYAERKITRDDDEPFLRIRRRRYLEGSVVFSLSPHWSAGGFLGYEHSTFENLNGSYRVSPALEFNVFPYAEVLRREITFAYRLGYRYNRYLEETIYEETAESLYSTSLYAQARFRQPWGNINASFDASAYLHDLSKNRFVLDSYVDLVIAGGLAVRFSMDVQLIRDQLNLPAGETSVEDLLLRQRQIATDFRFGVGLGVRYVFGAISNNVINYRL